MRARHELELRVTEAVDGLLNETQVRALRDQLQSHPDLLAELEAPSSGPMLKQVYQQIQPSPFAVARLQQKMRINDQQSWELELLFMFRRYVLALGILALSFVGALNMLQPTQAALTTDDIVLSEMNSFFTTLEQEADLWATLDQTP